MEGREEAVRGGGRREALKVGRADEGWTRRVACASVLAEARGTTEGVVYEEAIASDMLCAARNQPAVAPDIFRLCLCLMGSLC